MPEKIIQGNVKDIYLDDMQIYAITVNRHQAIPDVKDGLKSVARRILTDMAIVKHLDHTKHYTKCAGIVGSTMEYFHPHGDSSIYDVIVNMSNDFYMKAPLIDGKGNFGNMIGDDAAAMRYTECRLTEFADECVIGDLYKSKDIVDWVPNFNDSEMEPEYLPCKIPNLLINGAFALGVGMAIYIPKHSINDVLDAMINLIKDPNYQVVLIPDHCTPCNIIDTNWKAISNTGMGKYRARANINIIDAPNGAKLEITSVPDGVTVFKNKGMTDEGVIAKINEFVKSGKLPQVSDVYNDTKKNNMSYIIQLKPGADPQYVKEYLYKHTLLESTFTVNFHVLDGINPVRFSYKSYLEYCINFSMMTKFRSYCAAYQEANTSWREKQLYIMVMESGEIENIQKKVRGMKNVSVEARNEFMEYLIKKFNVSDIEAKFIMNMDFMKTASGYLPIYKAEMVKLESAKNEYMDKILSDDALKAEILSELEYFRKKYGRPRICRVIKDKDDSAIPSGEFRLILTWNNYLKKISMSDNVSAYRNDLPRFAVKVDNTESVIFCDRNGKAFKFQVHKIPLCDKSAQGLDLRVLVKNCTSEIVSVFYEPDIKELTKSLNKNFVVTITEGNSIKKMDLEDLITIPPSGLSYTKLNVGDFVKDIAIVNDSHDIIIYSNHKALRVKMTEIPHYKRTAAGVSAMNTTEGIDGLSVIYPNATSIVVITKQGRVNKFDVTGLARSTRNKAGSSVIKLGKTDEISSLYGVCESDTLRIVSKSGIKDIIVSSLTSSSSIGAGEKLTDDVIKTTILKL